MASPQSPARVTINRFGRLFHPSRPDDNHAQSESSLTLNVGSVLDFNLGKIGNDPSDLVNVGGTFTVAATPGATSDRSTWRPSTMG